MQDVGQRGDRHALVVRHDRAHDRGFLAFTQARGGEVDGLPESVGPERPGRGQPSEVSRRRGGIDHRGERRRVGRDDEVLGEPALQPEAATPKLEYW